MDLVERGFIGSASPSKFRLLWVKLLLASGRTPHLTLKLHSDTAKNPVRARFAISKATHQPGMYYTWALTVQAEAIDGQPITQTQTTYKLSLRPAGFIGRLDPVR